MKGSKKMTGGANCGGGAAASGITSSLVSHGSNYFHGKTVD